MAKINGKALLKSKTFYFSILVILVAIANLFGFQDFSPSPEVLKIINLITGIGVLLLRLKTSEPITSVK